MAARRTTLAQVAIAANVTASTASEALRGKGRMSQETRQRIISTAQALGYVAQGSARALRSGVTPMLALYMDTRTTHDQDGLPHAFWASFSSAFIKQVQQQGYTVIVYLDSDRSFLEGLPAQALVYCSTEPASIRNSPDLGFGSVLTLALDAQHGNMNIAQGTRELRVFYDYEHIGHAAATYLLDRGVRRCLLLETNPVSGFLDGIISGFISQLPTTRLQVHATAFAGEKLLAGQLSAQGEFDAIFDLASAGTMIPAALRSLGMEHRLELAVPLGGLAVLQQNELPSAQYRDSRFAYLSFKGQAAGENVANHVVARLAGDDSPLVQLSAALFQPSIWVDPADEQWEIHIPLFHDTLVQTTPPVAETPPVAKVAAALAD